MQLKLIFFLGLAGVAFCCCSAAPSDLKRPSPINPEIPMAPKPGETVTLITDPKEIAKYKREIGVQQQSDDRITAPTTIAPHKNEQQKIHQQQEQEHHHRRRAVEASTKTTPPATLPIQKPNTHEKIAANSKDIIPAQQVKHHRQKRDENSEGIVPVAPLIYRDELKQPISTLPHAGDQIKAPLLKPQILPATVAPLTLPYHIQNEKVNVKRDIPVPLVPKFQHPEESPKTSSESSESTEDSAEKSSSTTAKTNADTTAKVTAAPASTTTTTVKATTTEATGSSTTLAPDQKSKRGINSDIDQDHHKILPPENAQIDDLHKAHSHHQPAQISLSQHPENVHVENRHETHNHPVPNPSVHHPDNLQVEDLHESHPQHHPTQTSKNPAAVSTTSTEHPIFRQHPVPVAELFARGKTSTTTSVPVPAPAPSQPLHEH